MINQSTFSSAGLRETEKVSPPLEGPKRRFRLDWMGSVWFSLLISGIVGLLYALIVMGPAPLNPRNTGWLTSDAATYYIGWELFRQDPNVHWPLTYTDRVGYPYGESVALFDLNPLLALVLKPLSPVLPNPCQYLGIEVVLLCALQFFFALRLFHLILGPNPLGIALSSVFFLLSPPLNYRLVGHYALSNHWLLDCRPPCVFSGTARVQWNNSPVCYFRGDIGGSIGWHQSVYRFPGAAAANRRRRQPALATKDNPGLGRRYYGDAGGNLPRNRLLIGLYH